MGRRVLPAILAVITVLGGLEKSVAQDAFKVSFRVASYNAALSRDTEGALIEALHSGNDPQARAIAEVIQAVQPDILLINELDWDPDGAAASLFHDSYLAVGDAGIEYPFMVVPPVNTGIASGFDLNRDGETGGAADAWGWGRYPGHYGFAIYSRFPIETAAIRSFQTLPWAAMPEALLLKGGDGALSGADGYYADEVAALFPLSSKTHLDVPVLIDRTVVHILASHPTPPIFDGPEDRNGKRNHDEIRLWADYIDGADWITDDAGRSGGLALGARFVIVGDLNADPFDGDSTGGAVRQLLDHPLIFGSATDGALIPMGEGSLDQPNEITGHQGDPRFDTADFTRSPGNLRVDYVLPSTAGLVWVDGGVVWPRNGAPLAEAVKASDHRLVWVDLELAPLQ
ncbi:MAG: endonuclease/exonuclease/phosphatase family protein [Pseudomonadota bacterium]